MIRRIAAADVSARAAGLCLAALLAFAPWEFQNGVRFAGLNVTLAEILAALAAGASAIAVLLGTAVPEFRAHVARLRSVMLVLAAWGGLHVASALWAPPDHGEPANRMEILKFSARVLGMVALAGTSAALAVHRHFQRRAMGGLLLGLALLTGLGVAERVLGRDMEPFLRLFRDEPTWMFGEQRLSLVFYHANTAAAYLELAAPALVVLAARTSLSGWLRAVLGVWLAVVAVLLSLTYSRAGFGAAAAGAALLWWGARGLQPKDRRWLRWVSAGYALAVVLAYVINPEMRARFGINERSYRVRYAFDQACVGVAGKPVEIPIDIKNLGEWPLSNVQAPGHIIHTWLTPHGKRVTPGWVQTPLPTMEQGTAARVVVTAQMPRLPGDYILAVDILRDQVLRVSEAGNPIAWLGCLAVRPGGDVASHAGDRVRTGRPNDMSEVAAPARMDLERRHYWRAALLLFSRQPWLGYGADRFRMVDRGWVPDVAWDPRARAHSVPAETAVDFGLLGLGVLLALVLVTGKRLWRILRRPTWQPADGDPSLALAAMAALGGLAVHSQVDYFLAYTQVAAILWPLLGLACGAAEGARDDQLPHHRDDKPSVDGERPATHDPSGSNGSGVVGGA